MVSFQLPSSQLPNSLTSFKPSLSVAGDSAFVVGSTLVGVATAITAWALSRIQKGVPANVAFNLAARNVQVLSIGAFAGLTLGAFLVLVKRMISKPAQQSDSDAQSAPLPPNTPVTPPNFDNTGTTRPTGPTTPPTQGANKTYTVVDVPDTAVEGVKRVQDAETLLTHLTEAPGSAKPGMFMNLFGTPLSAPLIMGTDCHWPADGDDEKESAQVYAEGLSTPLPIKPSSPMNPYAKAKSVEDLVIGETARVLQAQVDAGTNPDLTSPEQRAAATRVALFQLFRDSAPVDLGCGGRGVRLAPKGDEKDSDTDGILVRNATNKPSMDAGAGRQRFFTAGDDGKFKEFFLYDQGTRDALCSMERPTNPLDVRWMLATNLNEAETRKAKTAKISNLSDDQRGALAAALSQPDFDPANLAEELRYAGQQLQTMAEIATQKYLGAVDFVQDGSEIKLQPHGLTDPTNAPLHEKAFTVGQLVHLHMIDTLQSLILKRDWVSEEDDTLPNEAAPINGEGLQRHLCRMTILKLLEDSRLEESGEEAVLHLNSSIALTFKGHERGTAKRVLCFDKADHERPMTDAEINSKSHDWTIFEPNALTTNWAAPYEGEKVFDEMVQLKRLWDAMDEPQRAAFRKTAACYETANFGSQGDVSTAECETQVEAAKNAALCAVASKKKRVEVKEDGSTAPVDVTSGDEHRGEDFTSAGTIPSELKGEYFLKDGMAIVPNFMKTDLQPSGKAPDYPRMVAQGLTGEDISLAKFFGTKEDEQFRTLLKKQFNPVNRQDPTEAEDSCLFAAVAQGLYGTMQETSQGRQKRVTVIESLRKLSARYREDNWHEFYMECDPTQECQSMSDLNMHFSNDFVLGLSDKEDAEEKEKDGIERARRCRTLLKECDEIIGGQFNSGRGTEQDLLALSHVFGRPIRVYSDHYIELNENGALKPIRTFGIEYDAAPINIAFIGNVAYEFIEERSDVWFK